MEKKNVHVVFKYLSKKKPTIERDGAGGVTPPPDFPADQWIFFKDDVTVILFFMFNT